MNISVVRNTAAIPRKDPAIARLAETEAQSTRVVFSRLDKHSCVDLDLRRHVEPRVFEWLHARFATEECSAQAIRAHMEKDRTNDGGSCHRAQVLSTVQVQRLMGEWFLGKYGGERLGDCQNLAQHHFDDLNSGMEAEERE
jgi:hypothetical protein